MILLIYFLLAVLFGSVSYRLRWLTLPGSIIASAFGFCLLWLGGWPWILPVLFFFGSSSLLSKLKKAGLKSNDVNKKQEDIRNSVQVLANGGFAWMLLVAYAIHPSILWYAGFIGAISAATADTWATEVGRLANRPPRHILTGKMLSRGESGGVTWQGSFGSMAGASIIGLLSVPFYDNCLFLCITLGFIAGMVGSMLDSVIGATLQAKYRVLDQQQVIESPDPLKESVRIQGFSWITNDTVNLCCTMAGSLIAMCILYLFM